jgi:hypothetical protein
MARRTFDVVDVTEIFIHWYAGRSISEVSVSLGVDRKTIRYAACGITCGLPVDAGLGGHRAQPRPAQPAAQHLTNLDH